MDYTFLLSLMLVSLAMAADKDMCGQSTCVKILGQSGKMTMASVDSADKVSSNENRVTIEFSAVKELDDNDTEVGKSGNPKHSLNSFASQSFVFSDIEATEIGNVGASRLNFTATLDLGAILNVQVFIFNESGTVTVNGESISVQKGTVKFGIDITNWNFCGCGQGGSQETGTKVEFVIRIKGKGDASKKSGASKEEYALDDSGSAVVLNKKLNKDGSDMDMESGYPKMNDKGEFIFRFPKFTDRVSYDPTIQLSPGDTGSGTVRITFNSAVITILALIVAALL